MMRSGSLVNMWIYLTKQTLNAGISIARVTAVQPSASSGEGPAPDLLTGGTMIPL